MSFVAGVKQIVDGTDTKFDAAHKLLKLIQKGTPTKEEVRAALAEPNVKKYAQVKKMLKLVDFEIDRLKESGNAGASISKDTKEELVGIVYGKGGSRRTRRRKTRTAKKSRRTYK